MLQTFYLSFTHLNESTSASPVFLYCHFLKAPLSCISKALSSCQSFSFIYTHHPALLHFIYRYRELADRFGSLVLEIWLTKKSQKNTEQTTVRANKAKTFFLTYIKHLSKLFLFFFFYNSNFHLMVYNVATVGFFFNNPN